jgi:hypothetical protein
VISHSKQTERTRALTFENLMDAAMGLHCNYDVEKIKALTKGAKDNRPEFFEPHRSSKVLYIVKFIQ